MSSKFQLRRSTDLRYRSMFSSIPGKKGGFFFKPFRVIINLWLEILSKQLDDEHKLKHKKIADKTQNHLPIAFLHYLDFSIETDI